jgi:hypothetical protein
LFALLSCCCLSCLLAVVCFVLFVLQLHVFMMYR